MSPVEPLHAVDARARIMWGEDSAKVRSHLVSLKYDADAVDALLEEIAAERAEVISRDGTRKLIIGALLVLAPIAYYWVAMIWLNSWSPKLFAALLVGAAVGVVKVTRGAYMMARPRSVAGDLSNAAD